MISTLHMFLGDRECSFMRAALHIQRKLVQSLIGTNGPSDGVGVSVARGALAALSRRARATCAIGAVQLSISQTLDRIIG
jgi:hypothetical protein